MKAKIYILGAGIAFLILSTLVGLVLFQALSAKPFTPLYGIRLAYAEPIESALIFNADRKHEFESSLAVKRLVELEEAMQYTLIESDEAARAAENFSKHAKKSHLLLIKIAQQKKYLRVGILSSDDEILIATHGRILSRLLAISTDPTEREAVNHVVQETLYRLDEISRYRKSMETRLKNDAKLLIEQDSRNRADEALATIAKLNAAKERVAKTGENYQKAHAATLTLITKTKTSMDDALKNQKWSEAFLSASAIIRNGETALLMLKAELDYKIDTAASLKELTGS